MRLGEAEHRLQLGLAAALEADAVRLAELDDLLDDVALLVHLDRIDRRVAARVVELLDRAATKRSCRALDARAEDVGEAQQHRQSDALLLEILRELEQVELAAAFILVGTHDDVSLLVDVEEAGAPALDVVERAGFLDGPRLGADMGEGFR